MKTKERNKSQLIKNKMVKYQINEKADKNEEEVEKVVVEEEVGQETDTVPEEVANDERT